MDVLDFLCRRIKGELKFNSQLKLLCHFYAYIIHDLDFFERVCSDKVIMIMFLLVTLFYKFLQVECRRCRQVEQFRLLNSYFILLTYFLLLFC